MPLVFAATTPHPPLLIPVIGKNEFKKVEKTKQAFELLEQELYVTKPEVIVIITPHGSMLNNAFSINSATQFISSFEEFGDFSTKKQWSGYPELASQIKELARENNMPVQLTLSEKLDHGASVPLFYLTKHIPNIKILPLVYSCLDAKKHLEFGKILKEVFAEKNERIAIVSSGDLSHGLTDDAPAGLRKTGKKFDAKIIELLETRNTAGMINLESDFIEDAAECGYRSLLILLGVLQNVNYTFKNYAYEAPFGVGYLTGEFVF